MNKAYNEIIEKLEAFKSRYDKHAGYQIKLQNNTSFFVTLSNIRKAWKCCDTGELEISPFPFYHSHNFARLLHVRCNYCGMAWVPQIDFSLEEYYSKEYPKFIQPFRTHTSPFYDKSNPFFKTPTYERMLKRAKQHLNLISDSTTKSILEIGPGVGILLRETKSNNKSAFEYDSYSRKILTNELNVRLVDIFQTKLKYDAIIASHVIEHLLISEAPKYIQTLHSLLKDNGKLLIEVPDGADTVERIKKNREKILMEPHTISFSAKGLVALLDENGFSTTVLSHGKSIERLSKKDASSLTKGKKVINSAAIIALCRKKQH